MELILLILVPLLISGGAFFIFKATITWKEFLLQTGISLAVAVLGWQIAKWGALRDTELLNGRITEKYEGTQHCCHCHTVCDHYDKKGNCDSSHEECDHIIDYYWDLHTASEELANMQGKGAA